MKTTRYSLEGIGSCPDKLMRFSRTLSASIGFSHLLPLKALLEAIAMRRRRYNMDADDFQGGMAPAYFFELLETHRITPTEFCVMLIIDTLNERSWDADGSVCEASNRYLAYKTGLSHSRLSAVLTNLHRRNLILRVNNNGRRIMCTWHHYREHQKVMKRREHAK